jgi:hypothetical protein
MISILIINNLYLNKPLKINLIIILLNLIRIKIKTNLNIIYHRTSKIIHQLNKL